MYIKGTAVKQLYSVAAANVIVKPLRSLNVVYWFNGLDSDVV